MAYYGRINDIVEFDYYGHFSVVLFKCDWFEAGEDIYGLTYVHFNKRCYKDDPFVLAHQVHQCFYVQDPFDENKHYVMKTIPRDLFNMNDQLDLDAQESYRNEPYDQLSRVVMPYDDDEVELMRKDMPATIFEMTQPIPSAEQDEVEYNEDSEYEESL